MTTRITIKNEPESNGDVILSGYGTCEGTFKGMRLFPGEERSVWITDNSAFFVTEEWPTKKPKAEASQPVTESNP